MVLIANKPPALTLALLLPLLTLSVTQAETVYERLSRTVVRLEILVEESESGSFRKPAGTGFFVEDGGALYLVTARHVALAARELRSRIPTRVRDSGRSEILELLIPRESWSFHSTEPQGTASPGAPVSRPVDVAVVQVPWPENHTLEPLRHCAAPCREGRDEVAAADPQPPDRVLILGYPFDLGAFLTEQRPLVRTGIVAMTAREPYIGYAKDGTYADARALVIDARSFPGNSGSPVFQESGFAGSRILLGLVTSGDDYLDVAIAEPVSRILETLEQARAQGASQTARWLSAVGGPHPGSSTR